MSGASILDTRTPYRSQSTQTPLNTTSPASQTGTPGLTLFQRYVHELIRNPHRERAARRQMVIERLRSSRDPMGYISELIDQCAVKGGCEGLDIGIDVLSHFGDLVLQYARAFWKKDAMRWGEQEGSYRHHFNDDAWYILLRAVALSDLDPGPKFAMLMYFSKEGPESVREACAHALGDLGGPASLQLLRHLQENDRSASVRTAAAEVLDDLEG
jgi:HEAT repeats